MASLKLKECIRKDANNFASVYWNSQLKEYVVKLTLNGERYEPADYFTDELNDAVATAKHSLGVK